MNLFDFKSVLGKIMFIVLIIIATHYHVLAGILAVLLVISMSQYVIEGMGNNTDSSKESADSTDSTDSKDSKEATPAKDAKESKESTESPMSLFKKNNCKNGILMKDGKEITPSSIKENFPNVKFDGESCNPCGDDCKFQIVSSAERVTNEENLRPQESNAQPVDRELVTKKQ